MNYISRAACNDMSFNFLKEVDEISSISKQKKTKHIDMGFQHSFKTRPGDRPGTMTGSRVKWVDPGSPGLTKKKKDLNLLLTETEAGQEPEPRFITSAKD